MMAGPVSPGVTAPVYHPAGKPLGGTCKVLSAFNPRDISAASTAIAGICTRSGTDRTSCETCVNGAVTPRRGRFVPVLATGAVAVVVDCDDEARLGEPQPVMSATNNAATTPTTQRGQRKL